MVSRLAFTFIRVMANYHNMSGAADAEWFKELSKLYPSLFFPMFHMQMRLQERICGKQFWGRLANKRVCSADGTVLYVKDVIGFHSNKQATRTIGEPKVRRHSAPSGGEWGRDRVKNGEFVDLMDAANIKGLQRDNHDVTVLSVDDCFEEYASSYD